MTPENAEAFLSQLPEFDWLTKDHQSKMWWTIPEIKQYLPLGDSLLNRRCQDGDIPGAFLPSRQAGWQIPRRGLVIFLANLRRGGRDDTDH